MAFLGKDWQRQPYSLNTSQLSMRKGNFSLYWKLIRDAQGLAFHSINTHGSSVCVPGSVRGNVWVKSLSFFLSVGILVDTTV